ncbi:MAG: hypothetical protein CMN87_18505 [Stappia sp.]|uniref:response regulator n=1 Tax=Stappia sp. TaxID=1870903 RepID=UPI000C5BD53E|nr:response regulator [Stappia sp.]MAA97463.1 hypothetical protein [Stappia sp.]MBM21996.1 hypothetical protein [Stappia sp.]
MSEMHLAKRAGEIEATGTASRCSTRVVVIDDDPDDLWLLRRSLTRASDEGAPVDLSICRGPAVALDFLRSQNETSQRASSPDLMLIDVNMPDMSGIELLRVIRSIERFRDTAIMVMTSAVDEELAEEASAAGADAVLTKPDTLAGLDALVASLLRGRAASRTRTTATRLRSA